MAPPSPRRRRRHKAKGSARVKSPADILTEPPGASPRKRRSSVGFYPISSDSELMSRATSPMARQSIHRQEIKNVAAMVAERKHHLEQFEVHPSLLSSERQLSRPGSFKGLMNLLALILLVGNFRMVLTNWRRYGVRIHIPNADGIMGDSTTGYPNFLLILGSNGFILFALWIEKNVAKFRISERTALACTMVNATLVLLVPTVVIWVWNASVGPSYITMFWACIVFVKLVSYAHVNYSLRQDTWRVANDESDGEEREHYLHTRSLQKALTSFRGPQSLPSGFTVKVWPDNLTLGHIYYFMCVPTLCYQVNFARCPRIRIGFLIKRVFELIFTIGLIYAIGNQYLIPQVVLTVRPYQRKELIKTAENLLRLAIPNLYVWLLGFYALFHLYLNIAAEVFRFADREFYRDWWNATTLAYFWRTWNIPVHMFFVRHVAQPMIRADWSALLMQVVIFAISGFFHELIVSVPLKMLRMWAFTSMVMQVPLAYITRRWFKGSSTGNMIFWSSIIMGQPLAILLYLATYLQREAGPPADLDPTLPDVV